jgi:ribosome-binding factor A
MSDSKLREQFVEEMGFTVKAIRMSPDHSKAFILWDVYNVTPSVAKNIIQKATPRLKAGIAKAMAAKNVPRLEFKHDKLSMEQEELDRIFKQIEKESES